MDVVDDDEPPMLVPMPFEGSVRIPVTVLTGYLGSGKTTLLNYILTQNHGKRIAVIENEFSAGLAIEGMIARNGVDDSNLSGFFELNNGCICCTVKDDLVATLEQLTLHRSRFDYIIIEATGVADPGPILSSLWVDDNAQSSLQLDGVIALVDVKRIADYLSDADIASDATRQIAYADRILLNKTDLVTSAELERAEAMVFSINSVALKQRTEYSKVDLSWVLDIHSYRGTAMPEGIEERLPSAVPSHMSSFLGSHGFDFAGALDRTQLERMLDGLLYNNGGVTTVGAQEHMKVYRIKGMLHMLGDSHLWVLQGVHDIFELTRSEIERGSAADRTGGRNRIIAIGKSLSAESLEERFVDCIATRDITAAPVV